MPRTEGVVVGKTLVPPRFLWGKGHLLATIRFETESGQTVECVDPTPRRLNFVEGQRVPVEYNLDNPQNAKILDSWFTKQFIGYALILPVIFILIVLYSWLRNLGN